MVSTLKVDKIEGRSVADTIAIPGHVIQVVQSTSDTEVLVNVAATWTSLMTANITPSSSTSKVLIMCSAASLQRNSQTIGYRISRGASVLQLQAMYSVDPTYLAGNSLSLNYLDSPATSSLVTYTWEAYNHTATTPLYWNYDNSDLESTNATMILMEIAA